MESQGPSQDQHLTDGERKVLLVLIAAFVLGSASLAFKSLRGGGAMPASSFSPAATRFPKVRVEKTKIPTRVPARRGPAPVKKTVLPVNLNTATAHELESLPGIGPAIAQRIVEDRTRRGPFHSLDELGRVKGVGLKMLERLRGKVTAGTRGQGDKATP